MDTTNQDRKFKPFFLLLDTNKDGAMGLNDILRIGENIRTQLGWKKEDARFVRLEQSLRSGWTQALQYQDLDHNGSLSYEEYLSLFLRLGLEWSLNGVLPAWAATLSTELQRALDVNGDGTYTADEYAIYLRSIGSDAEPKSAFAKLDTNKDGKLTADELMVLFKQLAGNVDPAAPGNYLLTGKY